MRFILSIIFLFSVAYTSGQITPQLVLPNGHAGMITRASFSPDGKNILTVGLNAIIWDANSGKKLREFKVDKQSLLNAFFGQKGELIYAASESSVIIWEKSTGREIKKIELPGDWITDFYLSNDENSFLTENYDGTYGLWDISSSRKVFVFDSKSSVFSLNSKMVLSVSGITPQVYSLDGSIIKYLIGHNDEVNCANFNSEGNLVITASDDSTARIWNINENAGSVEANEKHLLKAHNGSVKTASFSKDGNYAITSSEDDGSSRIWDVNTGRLMLTLNGHSGFISPDNRLVFTQRDDKSLNLYEISEGKLIRVITGTEDYIKSVKISPDCTKILTYGWPIENFDKLKGAMLVNEGCARLWDINAEKELEVLTGSSEKASKMIFSPDMKLGATTSNGFGCDDTSTRVMDLSTGKPLFLAKGHTMRVSTVDFTSDSKQLITSSRDDNTTCIFNLAKNQLLFVLKGHTPSLSLDGKYILTLDGDIAHLWDSQSGSEIRILRGHRNTIDNASFVSDGEHIVTHENETIRVWKISDPQEPQINNIKDTSLNIDEISLSDDGETVIAPTKSMTTKVLNINTSEVIKEYNGVRFAISSNSKQALTIIKDYKNNESTICLWDEHGRQLQSIRHLKGFNGIARFSKNGDKVLVFEFSSLYDESITVWDPNSNEKNIIEGILGMVGAELSIDGERLWTCSSQELKTVLWDVKTRKPLYTRLQLKGDDWLVYDEDYRFDGSPGAIEQLYFVCGLEVVELDQLKDSLWVPGLAEKITKGQPIYINDKPAPRLSDLNVCDLTPLIEPVDIQK